ncbi:glycoside hydrolase family 25 protein [Butyrivibrio sp. YAB3001]|uniref:glycoside hydrolase family 25 protein n=1 Tax=Butyrivibrio sp. YAB3001 TaxID=1520812 RepID=UPI0008F66B53|nr:glycoside hydrolase family 25 protein [Butyrivibrio sp. YAB3001]SFB66505.1 Lyzozyme M1 (1,4-beta-N-acetylmuramidase), GH25 family [Butyrivibrio sp. YAB3001]
MKKVLLGLLAVIVALLVIIPVGFLFKNANQDDEADQKAEAQESSIFETVSSLDALNMGIIDGDDLREEHGITEETSSAETAQNVQMEDVSVKVALRSIQNDLKVKITNSSTEKLIASVNFEVTITGNGKTVNYSDLDMDGIIYIPYIEAGDYTVFLSDVSSGNKNYHSLSSATITVSDAIEYAKVDVTDEIKDESQINVAQEDTKVQDVDETTDMSAITETPSEPEEKKEEIFDELTDEDELLLAEIEAESAAEEASKKAATAGASTGTVTAPTPAETVSNAQYAEAHSGQKGIDVSKHNGNIDWAAVKNSGINYAIIRCGYRGSSSGALVIDPLYYANMSGAQSAGISTGVYFFSQAVNEVEAVEEASMVLQLISGYSLQMPVYLDVEKSNGRGDALSKEERSSVCNAFLTTIRNAGYTAGIYSNKLWFEGKINTAAFTDYKIWLAQYQDIPTYTATRYDMWQYTSKGSVAGISGHVDMNVLK